MQGVFFLLVRKCKEPNWAKLLRKGSNKVARYLISAIYRWETAILEYLMMVRII